MKFERLPIPSWEFPDLVAFNRRVHERIDPWWDRRWIRRVTWTGLALFTLFAGVWLYFATGLPTSEKLLAYEPPLPTNVRGYNGDPVQTFARERRVELSYDEFPPMLIQAYISAEDKTFFTHGGIDYPGFAKAVFNYTVHVGRGGRVRRRLDHHPAGGEISAAGFELQRRAQDPRGDPRLSARIDPQQAADSRALPQFDLPRPQRLRRSGRKPRLFRQGRQRADPARSGLSRRSSSCTGQLRPGARDPEGTRPSQLCAAGDVSQRLHHRGSVAFGRGDSARHHPLRQQRQIPSAGRILHGGGPARDHQAVRRGLRQGVEQPLRRGPVGPHLDGPDDAGCGRAIASRRADQVRRRPRLARLRTQREPRQGRLGRPARPGSGWRRLSRLE